MRVVTCKCAGSRRVMNTEEFHPSRLQNWKISEKT